MDFIIEGPESRLDRQPKPDIVLVDEGSGDGGGKGKGFGRYLP
jgi:hypothetical protein